MAVDGNWPQIFWNLQNEYVDPEVKFLVRRQSAPPDAAPEPVVLKALPDAAWPLHFRGLPLLGETRTRRAAGVVEALKMGWDETLGTGRHIYLVLYQLIRGNISPRLLSGPVGIGNAAYGLTSERLNSERAADLMLFTAMLNVNLAVLNFLPIPILDGGHMVWLLYELLLRRRPPDRVVNFANIVGFVLLIGLMLFVLGLDIARHFLGLL